MASQTNTKYGESSRLLFHRFLDEFVAITGLRPSFEEDYLVELNRLLAYLVTRQIRPFRVRKRQLLGHINNKFRFNSKPMSEFYTEAAKAGVVFHYHQKRTIQRAFDVIDREKLASVLNETQIVGSLRARLLSRFSPVDEHCTLRFLIDECRQPSKLRRAKGNRDIEGQICMSLFSAFVWTSVPERDMHRFFDDNYSETEYRESFWEQLHKRSPHLFSRNNALHVIRISRQVLRSLCNKELVNGGISKTIEELYEIVDNYGFLAIVIEPIEFDEHAFEWELAANAILFAEKHHEVLRQESYFKWMRVMEETASHIPILDLDKTHFEIANEGFTYRDCFVMSSENETIDRLLLIFQKNTCDETPIPCPTCRTLNVRRNSYSSLGVRSWECNNVLCPDRSKYNRGKRYSFRGLVMRKAIEDARNKIPVRSVRRWSRDVVSCVSENEVAEMLIRHYSMCGDTVHFHNWRRHSVTNNGRVVRHHRLSIEGRMHPFWKSSFFRRYVIPSAKQPSSVENLGDTDFQVFNGDSARVLRSLPDSMFDGAVTSPPYYNAREYSQWPNIYCYLHDMFDINREVYRTLKPGAFYVYNLFDYFDNEKTIVFSAMGQRRMLLSAYTVDLFRRIGFELLGNVVWDKGDIEGKRGFNSGNYSPYYQSPFNCWEHVLMFRKPLEVEFDKTLRNSNKLSIPANPLSRVLRAKPVTKMVRGKNVYGHTAPFPEAIPEILISQLSPGMTVLDPFAGSLTLGRVAERFGLRSVCIESSEEYCRLGLRKRSEERESLRSEQRQLHLF